ncbi:MAG: NAD-dependent epimerase/dehydratase family protein [Candidatus Marinimicrobia bacterium]|nr:NAD-dependent epimerase/dehydratase family protein [Candidatus Neomarinimicrobiota bacterium]MCF7850439.1 NAD-dependent epimerase/dehydratase family protein [Candidatus Neomarinimicrobiota bacterium]MCF7904571.1 NAD-dependent epimerase/dehydratase family protein [Candidatus Neomarinimicrobiota bacterium]
MSKILVTGAAGFIGFHLSKRLMNDGHEIWGIDNLNDYYDPGLKKARLAEIDDSGFQFHRFDLQDHGRVQQLFAEFKPEIVIHLAAQAGVRYSLENPRSYIESNLDGFFNILEASKQNGVETFLYASSSSVYGNSEDTPFSTEDRVDYPVSLYAATKKSNELIAHTYSHLYNMTTVGLRFFTVYGPWGRPDMAYYFFTKAILEGKPIKLFNQGKNLRDYTYIDDIIESIKRILDNRAALEAGGASASLAEQRSPYYHVFNIGGDRSVSVLDFVKTLEGHIGKAARTELVEFQPGDVFKTQADTSALQKFTDFKPRIALDEGLAHFVQWYRDYHGK